MSKTCTRDHAGQMSDEELKGIEDLPSSQARPGRRRCAVCAYLLGVEIGMKIGRDRFMNQMVEDMKGRLKAQRDLAEIQTRENIRALKR